MSPLRLGLNIGYSGAQIRLPIDLIREADRLGFYAVWTAEVLWLGRGLAAGLDRRAH